MFSNIQHPILGQNVVYVLPKKLPFAPKSYLLCIIFNLYALFQCWIDVRENSAYG